MDEKTIETVMTAVCELCHWPYVEADQEMLDERCAVCPVERILKEVGGVTCDAYCEGCYYYGPAHRTCDYWEKADKLRGCPAGAGCDKKITEKEHRKMSYESKWDKDAGKQMWLQGKSDKEIAAAYGVSSTAVYQIRKKYWEPSALAEVAEEVPVQDPAQSCNHEQRENDASEGASTEDPGEDDSKVIIRALELMTAQIVTTLWNWESKEDLLAAKEFLEYLIGRATR